MEIGVIQYKHSIREADDGLPDGNDAPLRALFGALWRSRSVQPGLMLKDALWPTAPDVPDVHVQKGRSKIATPFTFTYQTSPVFLN